MKIALTGRFAALYQVPWKHVQTRKTQGTVTTFTVHIPLIYLCTECKRKIEEMAKL